MNSHLIPVFNGTISSDITLLCNARDLHAFLDVGRDFSTWICIRIAEYKFIENHDYVLVPQNWGTKTGRGGDRRRKDYHLTLDTAKELAMVERNDKGRQIRRYFIECEKQLHNKYSAVSQPVVALPESGKVPHPTSLEFDIPEPMVIVKGSAVSQLNALFGTVEYLESEMWPHLQALFPMLDKKYVSAFDTARLLLSLLKSTRCGCEKGVSGS